MAMVTSPDLLRKEVVALNNKIDARIEHLESVGAGGLEVSSELASLLAAKATNLNTLAFLNYGIVNRGAPSPRR